MQKNRNFLGLRPRPTGMLTALLPSWWEGAAGCPLLQNPTPWYRPFGSRASAISGLAHVRPLSEVHTPWENFLDKSPLGLCLQGLLLIGKWSWDCWVRAIGRRRSTVLRQTTCSTYLLSKPDSSTSFCSIVLFKRGVQPNCGVQTKKCGVQK